jgi:hypothetical protein
MTTTDRKTYNQRIRDEQKARGFRRVSVTLSPAELARFEASAKHHQERITSHVKACALAHLDAKYLVPPDIADRLDDLLAVMRGIGNNLNQLARYSNEMRYFLDTEEVRLNLKRMDEEVRRFVTSPVLVKEEGGQGNSS